jgi:thiol-disulfide isomerase/thioredoxin
MRERDVVVEQDSTTASLDWCLFERMMSEMNPLKFALLTLAAHYFVLLGLCTAALFAESPSASKAVVPIGSKVNELRFKDIRSVPQSLADLGDKKAYVFVFTTTQCPIVKKSIPKLIEMSRTYSVQDVVFVSVNVGAGDTIRDMAGQAVDQSIPFLMVKDYDLSVANALGVTRVPECVVLDQGKTIRYRGRVDDQFRLGGTKPMASREDLKMAIDDVLAGKEVSVAETTVDGCVITAPVEKVKVEDLSFYKDIAGIMLKHCSNCHHEGTAAPFALMSYEDVVSNAEMIREVVRDETMPPWYAHPAHGKFQNDASLTEEDKSKLLAWLGSDRQAGNVTDAPPLPQYADSKWRIGEPDMVITMLEDHTVPATGFVPYKYAVLPKVFFQETWVEAFEIRPENPSVVHHCNMAYVTTKGASDDTFITGYVPGGQPMDLGRFGNGVAYRIPAGSGLGLQIHYTTTGTEQKCRIQVGLRFPKGKVQKQLHHFVLDPRGWTIPPYEGAYQIRSKHTLEREADLLGMFTHMHVRGRDMTFFATKDAERECLLQIPNYNFEWQLGYELSPGTKVLSKGTAIEAVAHFDNSIYNPYNPDPKVAVRYGPQTVDEMFNGFVFYVDPSEQLGLEVNPKSGVRK